MLCDELDDVLLRHQLSLGANPVETVTPRKLLTNSLLCFLNAALNRVFDMSFELFAGHGKRGLLRNNKLSV